METLAARVRRHRQASGLTLDKLASASRISRSTLAKIEAGNTVDPGFSVVCRILHAAGASHDDLLELSKTTLAPAQPRAIGVGYQGLDQAGLISMLRQHHVSIVADVRLTPLSRKAGLSKRALREALEAEQIRYVHLPALGNPKDNRAGYSDPKDPKPRRRFEQLLASAAGQEQLRHLRALDDSEVIGVLCFERDEGLCHRQQVLQALAATPALS